MAYAWDASLVDRIMPRLKQFEATTGRRITPAMLDALIKGQLETEAGKANQSRAFDLQQQGIDIQKEQQDKAAKAATVKGAFDIASTAGMGYLAYKQLTKPSAMSELIAYQKGLNPAATPAIAPATTTTPAVTSATAPALTGAQAALGGGAATVGAQEIPAATAYASASEMAATTGQAAWAEPAAAGGDSMLATAGPYVSAAGVALAGRPVGAMIAKALGTHPKTTQDITEAAAYAGAGFIIGGPVGAVVGGVLGIAKGVADTVICTELCRQNELSNTELRLARIYRAKYVSDDMFRGYLLWASPIVKKMQKSDRFNRFFKPIAKTLVGQWCDIARGRSGTVLGRIIHSVAYAVSFVSYNYKNLVYMFRGGKHGII